MAKKRRLLGFSTVTAVVAVAMTFCVISESKKTNFNYEETSNIKGKSEAKGSISEEKLTDNKKVVNEKNAKEVAEMVQATPEPTKEPTQASLLGFEPIEGEVIPGIDYREYIDYNKFKGIAIVSTNQYVNIRKKPSVKSNIVGKIQPNAGCFVLSTTQKDGVVWNKIKSGDVQGYIKSGYLKSGNDAMALVSAVGRLVITSKCNALNVREKASTNSNILYQISKNEELDIVSVSKEWVEVKVDISSDETGGDTAFINRSFVNISFKLYDAIPMQELRVAKEENNHNGSGNGSEKGAIIDPGTISNARYKMICFAEKYIGYRYKFGGMVLTTKPGNGIDCSAFMQKIYASQGYSIPRNSRAQANCGTSITRKQLKPGDLVFYRRGGTIGHVAMYIGNNRIIHASNRKDGIKYSNMDYTTPAKYVRVVND